MSEPGDAGGQLARPQLTTAYQVVTTLTALLVLVQAMLAGRGWFVDTDLIDIHGIVGNITFLLVLGGLVLTWALGIPGGTGKRLLGLNVILLALVIVQTGLGYEGRDSAEAASWHIPNGVLIFGLAVMIRMLAAQLDKR